MQIGFIHYSRIVTILVHLKITNSRNNKRKIKRKMGHMHIESLQLLANVLSTSILLLKLFDNHIEGKSKPKFSYDIFKSNTFNSYILLMLIQFYQALCNHNSNLILIPEVKKCTVSAARIYYKTYSDRKQTHERTFKKFMQRVLKFE